LRKETILNLGNFHGLRAFLVVVRHAVESGAYGKAPHQPGVEGFEQSGRRSHTIHLRKLCRCRVCLLALYLAFGLKPVVQFVTVSPSALLVKFVGALLNLLLNRDQDGRLVGLWCECQWLFLDLVWMAIYFFSQLFSLPFQFVGFGTFGCHTYSLAC